MAHELEVVNGQAQMAYVGEVPWHGLGTQVDENISSNGMLFAAGLDWNVEKQPLFAEFNGDKVATGKSALLRDSDGKILDVVSDDWFPVQNSAAFDFFHDFVEAGDMQMHTAGSLKDGKIVWALAKVSEEFNVFGGDKVESYLLFSNPHQYGKCIDIRFTPIRVVCNNTLTLSLGQKSDMMVKLNHRQAFDAEMVKQTLGIAHTKLATYKDVASFLGSKRATEEKTREYLAELFPVLGKKESDLSRPASKILEVMETQPGAQYAEGSWWTAFNAVTYATDHLLGQNADTRLQSAWYGVNRNRKIKALELAVEYAEAA